MQNRPADIVAYAADQDGCGWHRILVPANFLASNGGANVIVEAAGHTVEWHEAAQPDVVVFQRQHTPEQIQHMQDLRRATPNAFFVYEIDDLLHEVPDSNYHSSFIPKNVEQHIGAAIRICDRTVVTTKGLAEWARKMGAKEVFVVPNYLPESQVIERGEPSNKKIVRVGWAGGVSHSGDLALLSDAISNVNGIQWVFFGMKPEMDLPENVEIHDFTPIAEYMDKLRSLEIDLFVIPLAKNSFNESKSDLKLIEAGAVGAAVIASPTQPYAEFSPPVYAWADNPAEWAALISEFKSLSYSKRKHHATAMQKWVRAERTYEANLYKRNTAWLPADISLWTPSSESVGGRPLFVVGEHHQSGTAFSGLEEACAQAIFQNADVLWMRPGTTISPEGVARLRVAAIEDRFTASIAPLANDGCNAFPRLNQMTPLSLIHAKVIDSIVRDDAAGQRGYMAAFSGPCLLIRNQGLRTLGAPDPASYGGDEELALVDWTSKATERGLRNIQIFDVFARAASSQSELTDVKLKRLEARDVLRFIRSPATPMDDRLRQSVDLKFLTATYQGLRQGVGGLPNDYMTWAALKADPQPISDGGKVQIARYGKKEDAHTGNTYQLCCEEDTILQPFAAALIQDALDAGADFVFGDHEEIDEQGNIQPYFKSGFDRILLLSADYIAPICGYESNGMHNKGRARMRALTARNPVHIPYVLGRVKRKTKDVGHAESLRIKESNDKCDPHSISNINPHLLESGFVFYRPVPSYDATVAVIVHVGDNPDNLPLFLGTLTRNTSRKLNRIVVVSNSADPLPSLGVFSDDPRFVSVYCPGNVSQALNFAASECVEDVLIFMKDDVRIIVPTWADSMIAYLESDRIGAVGSRIYHQAGKVIHAGVAIDKGIAAVVHGDSPANSTGYFGAAVLSHEASAVSRQCLAIRRELFEEHRFDTKFNSDFMDYDLCVRLMKNRHVQVVDCSAQMQSATYNHQPNFDDFRLFAEAHARFKDPYLNPNFALTGATFDYGTLAADESSVSPLQPRVLLINDSFDLSKLSVAMVDETKRGSVVLRAVLDGFSLSLVAPVSENVRSVDVRDPGKLRWALEELHVSRIVMPYLLGQGAPPAVAESIKAMMATGIQFDYLGGVETMLCPRLSMIVDGEDCGEGFRHGAAHCQACVNKNGSPFGLIDVQSWLNTWAEYADQKAAVAGVS